MWHVGCSLHLRKRAVPSAFGLLILFVFDQLLSLSCAKNKLCRAYTYD